MNPHKYTMFVEKDGIYYYSRTYDAVITDVQFNYIVKWWNIAVKNGYVENRPYEQRN